MSYKRENESYLDYRKRIIDTKSASFCGAKWGNATIWLGNGMKASCHHPSAHKIRVEDILTNPKGLHNTLHTKTTRKQMQAGERPPECDYCWKIEDMGRDAVSDRVFKTVIYTEEELEKWFHGDPNADVDLVALEIAFDRVCNFACSYCNASFSTTWGKDITKNGPYQNLQSDGARAFQQDGKWAQPYPSDEVNPYIQAFWKWWEDGLQESLRELRITGGEPLMSDQVWKLLDIFEEEELEMRLAINSNLGAKAELINRLIQKSQKIKNLDIYTSCEAATYEAEYIRDGLKWDQWLQNFNRLIEEGNCRSTHVMMTINSLCLFSLTDFLDNLLAIKTNHGKHHAQWSVNILRFPSFMSPLALPDHIRTERKEHLGSWLEQHKDFELISDMEREGLRRLVDYLDVVKTPHRRTSSVESQHRDFRMFYAQYDVRRGKDFRSTFQKYPSLIEWYDKIPLTCLPQPALVDGDSTKGINVELRDYNPGQDEEGKPT
jgi:organic radical activating enzyme